MSLKFTEFAPISNFVGREHELERLNSVLAKPDSSIIVLHGRRRVGKSELLEQALKGKRVLKFEGLEGRTLAHQRQAFLEQLSIFASDIKYAKLNLKSWREVFGILADAIKAAQIENCIVYLEELQWMAHYRNDLVSDLKYVWDNQLRKLPGFKLILCGSATAFMVKKVVRSKALYSRSMYEIPLEPFSLGEARRFLSHYSDENVLEAYLLVGGIPEYLRYFQDHETPQIALRKEAFIPGGYFLSEFGKVFTSSLAKFETHKQIVEAFAAKTYYARAALAQATDLSLGGSLSTTLADLELIGLIGSCQPLPSGKILYYLRDPYLNIYLKLIRPNLDKIRAGLYKRTLYTAMDPHAYRQYLGYSFERFCLEFHYYLADILSIAGVEYAWGPYRVKSNSTSEGFQFDLVFKRKDRCFTLFELKYKQAALGKEVIDEFEHKVQKLKLPKGYNMQSVLVSAGPLAQSLAKTTYFNRIIQLKELMHAAK